MSSIAASGVTAPRVTDAPAPSNLAQRVISALVLAPIALAFVWAGGLALAVLLAIVGVLMVVEWERLTGGSIRDKVGYAQIVGVLTVMATCALISIDIGAVVLLVWILAVAFLGRERGLWPALGSAYVGLPLIALHATRDYPGDGLLAVLWLLAVVWSMDIFAYVFGRLIGGPKLAPSISPKKTWAGLIGGMSASAVAGFLLAPSVGAEPTAFSILSGALGGFSQVGDMFESHVKRRFGVKDSGNLIPGHGGILDRVDGLVFAAMAAGALLLVFGTPFGIV